jgi:2-polyprenyl-3-methyl-5-hydroxy-6-metoxy-1,4-benzoquinol methylase
LKVLRIFANTLFEEFVPKRRFTNTVLGHVLEHVEDPDNIIQDCIEWLEPGGRIIAATPNADSLHRQLAVLSGLISNVHELTSTDISIGHRRVVNPQQLRSYFMDSRLHIDYVGGYYMKSFSNQQIEQIASKEVQKSLMVLGEKYFEIAADIYIVASRI